MELLRFETHASRIAMTARAKRHESRIFATSAGFVWFNPQKKREAGIMGKKLNVIALAVLALGFATAVRSNAGTEIVRDYSAPAPAYNYAPPPPVVYYAPPPVQVVVYPRPFRVFGFQRVFVRRPFYRPCWR
jgi:hypothetical protein